MNWKEEMFITYKYKCKDGYKEGCGYVYNTSSDLTGAWMVGNSCKLGGVSNIDVQNLIDVKEHKLT